MRYSLLTWLRCPECRGALACFIASEAATVASPVVAERADRAPIAGQAFAPTPVFRSQAPLAARLRALGGPAAPDRNRAAEVDAGILICGECARWFPVTGTLPELLPDHLRDAARDAELLSSLGRTLPADVRSLLRMPGPAAADDPGAHYKRAEIGIESKIDDPVGFFGPGYSSPFNPGNTEFTLYLIKLFASVVTLLDLEQGATVVDSGCGYSWTTEWLARSGLEAIGVDICRPYLEIGVRRMGPARPHLVVADVEKLPIADACADAVLAYESFHHLPDRRRAMAGYARVLKSGSPVVLAEPGAAHEHADVSVETMSKYGILEKGMELADVEGYVEGLPFDRPEQHYVLRVSTNDLEQGIYLPAAWRRAVFHGNLFRIRKSQNGAGTRAGAAVDRVARSAPVEDVARSAPVEDVARSAPVEPVARGGQVDDKSPAAESIDLRVTHERMTREWAAELQRTAAELRAVTSDLEVARSTVAAMERSSFWKARKVWVWLRERVRPG